MVATVDAQGCLVFLDRRASSQVDQQKNGFEVTNEGTLGVLEVLVGKSGFIRRKNMSYTPSDDDN